MSEIQYEVIEKIYIPAIESKTRYVLNEGGTRSGKTFSTLQALFHIAVVSNQPLIISIVSETLPHLKKGAMRDFINFLKANDLYNPAKHNKTENIYHVGKSMIEFFSADSSDKFHGPERDILFVNELQNISYEVFFHLAQRTRLRVFADWNPTHEFFIHQKYLNNPDYTADTTYIHSTIFDNPFVAPAIKTEVLRRAKHDENYKRVYLQGKIGTLEGLIFPDFSMIDRMPEGNILYGLDFGFSSDPSVLVGVIEQDDAIYIDEIFYNTGLHNRDICTLLNSNGIRKGYDEITADSAEPKSISEISLAGFNIKPALKGADSVRAGIDRIKSKKIYVTKNSVNLIRELRSYRWVTDKNGKATNKPMDGFDHAIDAVRYAIVRKKKIENFVI